MYKIVPWSEDLDLSFFYEEAGKRGFKNNSSERKLVRSLDNEKEKQVWILYFNDVPVGSVAAHSFDSVMGPNAYRIAARTCILTHLLHDEWRSGLRTKRGIINLQNPTDQILIPTCMKWVNGRGEMYGTSNAEATKGSFKKVHTIYFPLLEKEGVVERVNDVVYRGTEQTVWKINQEQYLKKLEKTRRWSYEEQ